MKVIRHQNIREYGNAKKLALNFEYLQTLRCDLRIRKNRNEIRNRRSDEHWESCLINVCTTAFHLCGGRSAQGLTFTLLVSPQDGGSPPQFTITLLSGPPRVWSAQGLTLTFLLWLGSGALSDCLSLHHRQPCAGQLSPQKRIPPILRRDECLFD